MSNSRKFCFFCTVSKTCQGGCHLRISCIFFHCPKIFPFSFWKHCKHGIAWQKRASLGCHVCINLPSGYSRLHMQSTVVRHSCLASFCKALPEGIPTLHFIPWALFQHWCLAPALKLLPSNCSFCPHSHFRLASPCKLFPAFFFRFGLQPDLLTKFFQLFSIHALCFHYSRFFSRSMSPFCRPLKGNTPHICSRSTQLLLVPVENECSVAHPVGT